MKLVFTSLIKIYQLFVSPFLGRNCRFTPSCSCYAKECFDYFPVHIALWYSLVRIFKCHPFHEGGLDPIPSDRPCNKEVSSRCTKHPKEV